MAFAPPVTFAPSTTLTSAALEGNFDALRVYLNENIVAGDFELSKWIQPRHIQPPEYLPYSGVQHGVSGYQGGQWAGGSAIRLTFATKYLTGNGRTDNNTWIPVPNTSFTLDIRRNAKLLFHYWWELEAGEDTSVTSYGNTGENRLVWIAPWVSNVNSAGVTYSMKAQETRNNENGLITGPPVSIFQPFPMGGGYDSKSGTLMLDYNAVGTLSFGLASHSQVDRVGIVNWGVAVEVFYL